MSQRHALNYTGFVFDFKTAKSEHFGRAGTLSKALVIRPSNSGATVWSTHVLLLVIRRTDRLAICATAATDGGGGNGSNLKSNQVAQNPFLSSLPGDGNGQTLVTLAPCSGNTVHTHPRGSGISFGTYGEM